MADFPLATIPATEVRTLRSSAVDQEYLVSVALPFQYIGYPTSGSLAASHAQVMHLRMRDLTPVRDEAAEKFIQEHFPVSNSVISGGPVVSYNSSIRN